MYTPTLLLATLFAFTSLTSASSFGSCDPSQVCGFMCCASTESCMSDSFCVDPSWVSSMLSSNPSLASSPSVVSSLLCAIAEPSGMQSVWEEFSDILTDAPKPSALPTTLPEGFTVPTRLETETMGEIPSTVLVVPSTMVTATATATREVTATETAKETGAATPPANETLVDIPASSGNFTPVQPSAVETSTNAAGRIAGTYGFAAAAAVLVAGLAAL